MKVVDISYLFAAILIIQTGISRKRYGTQNFCCNTNCRAWDTQKLSLDELSEILSNNIIIWDGREWLPMFRSHFPLFLSFKVEYLRNGKRYENFVYNKKWRTWNTEQLWSDQLYDILTNTVMSWKWRLLLFRA